MGESIEYPDVLQEVRGAMNPGRLKLQSGNVIFKNIKTGIVEQFQSSDIEAVNWLLRARGHCLKFMLENGNIHRFDGLRESEFDKLSAFVKTNYEKTLEKVDLSHKGWNWGSAVFKGNSLDFRVGRHTAFELPLGNVSHSVVNKNEVTLEFHQNDDAAISLSELRFHIPAGSNPEVDAVEEFHKNIMSKADIILATGDAITLFSDVQCLTPRGRYDIKMYPTFLQLHGKTFDYKIPYTTILRLFLLPHKDQRHMFFVVSLDPPIKQGQTRYHFLILLFNKEEEATLELALSEDELEESYHGKLTKTMSGAEYEMVSRVMKAMVGRKITVPGTFLSKDIEEKYEGKLTKEMSGLEYELISRIMKALVQRKITVPGSFSSHSNTNCVGCSYKAGTGLLYPLERGFIFVHKPAVHVRFDEISSINFARSTNSLRSFDFEVETKNGTNFTFQAIDKDEYGKLYDFVTNKKLRVKNTGNKPKGGGYNEDLMESDDEGAHDAYMERMKAEGLERVEDDNEEDEDSSEDEDYMAPEDSGSEVAEEFDSNPETSSDSDDSSASGSGQERRKKEKRKERKTKTIPEPGTRKRRTKKEKKEVDPDKPKRPSTAYFMWFNSSRASLKEEYPDIPITELSKKAGERWREMTSDDKKEWEEKAGEAKAKYEVAMNAYKEKLAAMSPEERAARTGGGASSSPKKRKSKPKAKTDSPTKAVDTKAGSGVNFKSKEFIEDSPSSDSSSESDDDKPLAKKARKGSKAKKNPKEPEKSESEKSDSASDQELPSDHEEEILSTPPGSSGGSDSDSD